MLKNKSEPALFRAMGAFLLGMFYVPLDRDLAADYFRQVEKISKKADPGDANREVVGHRRVDGKFFYQTAQQELDRIVGIAKVNTQNIMDPINGPKSPEALKAMESFKKFRHGDEAPKDAYVTLNSMLNLPPDSEFRKRLLVGGNACDCCGKTLEELGVVRLRCCSQVPSIASFSDYPMNVQTIIFLNLSLVASFCFTV